jgi:hypothetical protein
MLVKEDFSWTDFAMRQGSRAAFVAETASAAGALPRHSRQSMA